MFLKMFIVSFMQLNFVAINEKSKGDSKKFEVWYRGREEVYTLYAVSASVKQEWVSAVKKILQSLPKCDLNFYEMKGKEIGRIKSLVFSDNNRKAMR